MLLGSDLGGDSRDEFKSGSLQRGWDQKFGAKVRQVDGGGSKYLLGEDVWVGYEGVNEGWFLSLEE